MHGSTSCLWRKLPQNLGPPCPLRYAMQDGRSHAWLDALQVLQASE
jgi:hypothetical protein